MPGRMGASPFPWIQRHDLRINHIFVCTKCIHSSGIHPSNARNGVYGVAENLKLLPCMGRIFGGSI